MSSHFAEPPAGETDSPSDTSVPRAPDPIALAQLWAGQFQHLATLGVAGAGGVLVLLQAELIPLERRWWLSLVLFAVAAAFSMYGQITVVNEASTGRVPGRQPRIVLGLAVASLSAAGAAAIGALGF